MTHPPPQDPRINKIVEVLQDKKALDIELMDLRQVTDSVDYFIICTGTSEPHIKNMVKDLTGALKQEGHSPWHVEGTNNHRWVLVDYVDIAVHIFRREARQFYGLERLWGDAPTTSFDSGGGEEDAPQLYSLEKS